MSELGCHECGLEYGGASWIEAIIPDHAWNAIRPEGSYPGGGILCISCIAKRLYERGFNEVPVWLCGMEVLSAYPGDPSYTLAILREWQQ